MVSIYNFLKSRFWGGPKVGFRNESRLLWGVFADPSFGIIFTL